jgi:putative ABC transport system permease protein
MPWSSLLLALREIRRNLMRAILTMLGIVIGVSAVITMVTLGNGATRSVQDQISSIGTNLLMMRPGQRMGPAEGAPNFKVADAEAIEAQVSSARAVAPVATKSTTVIHQAKNWATVRTSASSSSRARSLACSPPKDSRRWGGTRTIPCSCRCGPSSGG